MKIIEDKRFNVFAPFRSTVEMILAPAQAFVCVLTQRPLHLSVYQIIPGFPAPQAVAISLTMG